MRFVFADEAGTSGAREEKARVVAAVIMHADRELPIAERLLNEALGVVPREWRDGFIFHAEDIMNNPKYRDRWRLTDRVDLLKSVMSIPRRMNMPLVFSMVSASAPSTAYSEQLGFSLAQDHHIHLFQLCMSRVDRWMREFADPDEIATAVCEQHDMQRQLVEFLEPLRTAPYIFDTEGLVPTQMDQVRGYNAQSGVMWITRIRRAMHFVSKEEEPLVWIADACAYGIKRYFGKQDFGQDFIRAIQGFGFDERDWVELAPASETIWRSPPDPSPPSNKG